MEHYGPLQCSQKLILAPYPDQINPVFNPIQPF
jgi:hypothetical protein